jgi:hypothetical protein
MMSARSILAGKTYRTPVGEIRQAERVEGGEVVFIATSAPHGVGIIGKSAPQRLSLPHFAEEVESEVR